MNEIPYGKMSSDGLSRRRMLLMTLGASGTAAAGVYAWRHLGLRARLFNPFTKTEFRLEPVEGVLSNGSIPVPGFAAEDLKGQVVILNHWASWCPPCVAEHPTLVELAKDRRIHMFGANFKDKPENAAKFLREHGNPFVRVGADRSGFLASTFGARGVPFTSVINRKGEVVATWAGPLDNDSLTRVIRPAIELALKG